MNQLYISRAGESALDKIMEIYRSAQDFMIAAGNPGQWGHIYPSRDLIKNDIEAGRCFLICGGKEDSADEPADQEIHGVFALFVGDDPTYRKIYDGAWLNDAPYVTIHRIAGDGKVHGILKAAADYCKESYDNIRIDTHKANLPMQRQIEKNGFVRCGTIYVEDGSPRIAYHWTQQEPAS